MENASLHVAPGHDCRRRLGRRQTLFEGLFSRVSTYHQGCMARDLDRTEYEEEEEE
jgi:hypothetical protein